MAAGISINNNCIDLIKDLLPDGGTILEFGSGEGTTWLSDAGYTMFSVENQSEWMDKYPKHTTYINCSIKYYDLDYSPPKNIFNQTGWYNPNDLFPNLPKKYDLILVDGPGGRWGRGGFYKHIDKFNTDVPMVFDDINRTQDSDVMEFISDYIGREYKIIDNYTGVILGKSN
jgi:hypothetical protein|tara:strand:- start:1422 stop:1937 length:516 start_codon:yes stop_codon:yes gene_type:complete